MLCLQEVQLPSHLANSNPPCSRMTLRQHHLYLSRHPDFRRQAILVHNSQLPHICNHRSTPCSVSIEFTDFILFSIHLKHRCETQLLQLLDHLRVELRVAATLHKPCIVAGDWNEQLGPPFTDHVGDFGGREGIHVQHVSHVLVEHALAAINSFVQHEPSRHGHARTHHSDEYGDLAWLMVSHSFRTRCSASDIST